jgi:hypothetical protein
MKIRTPSTRAYYPASANEKDRLLCWIPPAELERMVQDGRIVPDTLDDYPYGLELEVSRPAFNELHVDLGVDPEVLSEAYAELLEQGLLPESERVDGASLERVAQRLERGGPGTPKRDIPRSIKRSISQKLPEPAMTDGEDPMTVMFKLQ